MRCELVATNASCSVFGSSATWPRRPETHHIAAITTPTPMPPSTLSRAAPFAARERPADQRAAEAEAEHARPASPSTSRWPRATSDGRSVPLAQRQRDLVDGVDAGHRRDAFQRRERRDAEHDEDDHRLQVAAADAHQRLAAAARRQHHAEAEHRAADQRREPDQARPGIDALRRIDPAGRDHRVEADHRDAHRHAPTCACGAQSPMLTMSETAPIVQKCVRCMIAPSTTDSPNAAQSTCVASAPDVDVLHQCILRAGPRRTTGRRRAARPQGGALASRPGARDRPARLRTSDRS